MTAAETIGAVASELGLTMTAQFVPWSKSRNKAEKTPSLNWIVTIKRDGRDVLTTDYMMGIGHCPSYKPSQTYDDAEAVKWECENGRKSKRLESIGYMSKLGKPINPPVVDVLHSLCLDAEAIDYTFEEWASNLGYDTDSRKAEAMYRACLDIAIKLRSAIGDAGLSKLREACQNY